MIIKLSPVRMDEELQVEREGDRLYVDGEVFDFGPLIDGATLPAEAISSKWFEGQVGRVGSELQLTLVLPHAADAPHAARFPADLYPRDGQVQLPGQELRDRTPAAVGVIDWSRVITVEAKTQAAAEQLLAVVTADLAQRRAIADVAIAPLQDAFDIGEATPDDEARLKLWKKYRVALSRVPEQGGYPNEIDWPAPPA